MYIYDEIDQKIVDERVAQYRDQTERFLAGHLTEEQFLPLRLQNGLYVQRLAPMLRIAVPYGNLNAAQIRTLAGISRRYDKGYAHLSTRQNVQINWPKLEQVPDILEELAAVQMHAIQTSGNCIRNTTADQYSGVAADEVEDARPWCELIRQWSTFHPEFAFLPRKFKIAVCGSANDRAAMAVHDIGVRIKPSEGGETRFEIYAGGGLGRTPMLGQLIHDDLPWQHLISYLDAILRVYNQHGRRDNKYKARIKILVKAMGAEAFKQAVEEEWAFLKDGPMTLDAATVDQVKQFFQPPAYEAVDEQMERLRQQGVDKPGFGRWLTHNTADHKQAGYRIVVIPLKTTGYPPGDITAEQLELVADLCEQYGFGEARVTHQQNLVLPDVRQDGLFELWQQLRQWDLATPNLDTLNDMICCPGGDYCALANAKSIPVAEAIQRRFDNIDYLYDLGPIDLNISGCMNACGHHHVGHIGILGVDKKGEEFYQVSLGGNQGTDASLGKILGPSFAQDDIPDVVQKLLDTYLSQRAEEETFLHTYRRIGLEPFKEAVYA